MVGVNLEQNMEKKDTVLCSMVTLPMLQPVSYSGFFFIPEILFEEEVGLFWLRTWEFNVTVKHSYRSTVLTEIFIVSRNIISTWLALRWRTVSKNFLKIKNNIMVSSMAINMKHNIQIKYYKNRTFENLYKLGRFEHLRLRTILRSQVRSQ